MAVTRARQVTLLRGVFEFGEAVGRVDGDEDEAGAGGGELGDDPLGVVGGPDADAVAGGEAECEEAGGEFVGLFGEFAPGPADGLRGCDEGGAVAGAFDEAVEMAADGFADERLPGGAAGVADWGLPGGHGGRFFWLLRRG